MHQLRQAERQTKRYFILNIQNKPLFFYQNRHFRQMCWREMPCRLMY